MDNHIEGIHMKTIIDTAVESGKFTTLLAVLKAASLVDTLRTPGPYTVFAPTDDAFKRLAPGTVDALIKNIRKLKTILTYHVISGTLAAKDIQPGEIKTVEGSSLVATVDDAGICVNGARVVQADIAASNGVIHAIDAVIMAKATPFAAVA
jgi:uncharacterized surface protein with fasciclin (FAS1) repeats